MMGFAVKIQDKLLAWGRCRGISVAPNGYPHQAPFANQIRNPGQATVKPASLTEDEVIRIDREIAALKLKKRAHYLVIELAYRRMKSDHEIGRRMRKSRSWAREIRQNAEYYLEAKLE